MFWLRWDNVNNFAAEGMFDNNFGKEQGSVGDVYLPNFLRRVSYIRRLYFVSPFPLLISTSSLSITW